MIPANLLLILVLPVCAGLVLTRTERLFMILGPMVAGKTGVTGALAEFMFNSDQPVPRIGMIVVIQLVEAGGTGVPGRNPSNWRFTDSLIRRGNRTLNMPCELDVNLAGVAPALVLLGKIDQLRDRQRALEGE